MIYTYPACFYVDDDGITVIFPDLNYLASQGETIDDAMKKAIDCLAGYIYEAKLTNDKINKASELKDRFGAEIMIMDVPEIPVSSTVVREMMEKGRTCKYYLDDKVIEYIKDNMLYLN